MLDSNQTCRSIACGGFENDALDLHLFAFGDWVEDGEVEGGELLWSYVLDIYYLAFAVVYYFIYGVDQSGSSAFWKVLAEALLVFCDERWGGTKGFSIATYLNRLTLSWI